MRNIRREKGVALLFALGVMSLMLVSGLAFLANALMSQKIAVNNNSRGVSKMLALSAAHRSMYALMNFLTAYKDDCREGVLESVFSRVSSAGTNDQLEQKLTVKQDNKTFYDAAGTSAKWIYVHEDGSDSAGTGETTSKITGRFAFQVLPPLSNSKSRLPLFAATRGATMEAGEGMTSYSASAKKRIPQISRWGIDGDELNFSANAMFPLWIPRAAADSSLPASPIREFDTFFSVLSYTGGPLKKSATVSQENINNRRRGIRYWFTEGMGRISPETFFDGTVWRNRFNLGHVNGLAGSPVPKTAAEENSAAATEKDRRWYQRLIIGNTKTTGSVLNADAAADALANTALEYSAVDVTSTDGSARENVVSGLPFLKRIAHEAGSFTDNLTARRKQITANLNDYCDADDIPTSDVPANTWTAAGVYKDRSAARPSYTGNEKTPYINEIMILFPVSGTSFRNGSDKCAGVNVRTTLTFAPRLLAELADIYGLAAFSPRLRCTAAIKSIEFRLTGNASDVKVSYQDGDESKTQTLDSLAIDAAFKYETEISKDFDLQSTAFSKNAGYHVAHDAFASAEKTLDLDLSEAIRTKVTESGISNITAISELTLSNLRLSISKVKFTLSDLVLSTTISETDIGADYVKTPSGEIVATANSDTWSIDPENSFGAQNGSSPVVFYLGNMEVRDPRQNLNIVLASAAADTQTTSTAVSDWFFTPVLGRSSIGSMTPVFKNMASYTVQDPLDSLTGTVNSVSNPSAPKDGTGTLIEGDALNNVDTENATNPVATATDTPAISTAVIRNAPMRSPWELGFISRGEAFQTINLKKAGGLYTDGGTGSSLSLHANPTGWGGDGTKYSEGDGGILDEIKMTDHVKSFGKVNLNAFGDTPPTDIFPAAADIARAVFEGVRHGQTAAQFLSESGNAQFTQDILTGSGFPQTTGAVSTGTALTGYGSGLAGISGLNALTSRSQILQNSDAQSIIIHSDAQTDAAKEELIGKTINLFDVSKDAQPELPNTYRIAVVAQTIRDLSGTVGRTGTGVSAGTTGNSPDQVYTKTDCALGTFDVKTDVSPYRYYDEILSEVRMLVTVERINYYETSGNVYRVPRARLRIRQIEYLE